jgi:hypothetical protein
MSCIAAEPATGSLKFCSSPGIVLSNGQLTAVTSPEGEVLRRLGGTCAADNVKLQHLI